ncbi:DDB1- and CUL4-associated factor 5 [Bulinus truncatus]|nr:DDB1- and CUL4-associated factor 5 [Bulinus truncatus]
MEFSKGKFNTTPLSLIKREREGNLQSSSFVKELFFGHRLSQSQGLYKLDLRGHYGCVNAIEFSSDGELIASGGDDRRLLLWNVGQAIFDSKAPTVIDTLHISNINSCCFDADNRKVATGGNDGQVIVHDFNVKQSTAVYGLSDAVYALSPDPINSTIIATASDDGKAQILDTRMPTDSAPFVLADLKAAMHSIAYNPMDPRLLATANSKHGLGLWDIRMPFMSLSYKSGVYNCMSVRFNSRGDRLLALRRRSSPVLFDIAKMQPMFEFDYKTYYNACTLKSCSFAGLNDEFVMSGSDDFCVYLWKIPADVDNNFTQSEPQMILRGHRSIVNQVRYCPQNQFIMSSGVEKLIKVWSPYALPKCTGRLLHSRRYGDDDEIERNAYSHEEYIHMVLQAGSFLSHDYTNGSTEEEPCMIAFFDSLIQREVEHSIELDESISSSSSSSSSEGDDDDGAKKSMSQRALKKKKMFQCDSDSSADSPSHSGTSLGNSAAGASRSSTARRRHDSSSPARHRRDSSSPARRRHDSSSPARPLDPSTPPYYMDLGSSSDSDSEVGEILSAMYSRYMTSRERIMSGESKPSGRKISDVIVRGKQKNMSSKKSSFQRRLHRIREDLQHSGDQYLRDSSTSMSILVDVIDNFVDNLVNSESNSSRSLSDIRDGLTDSVNGQSTEASVTPADIALQAVVLESGITPAETPSSSHPIPPVPQSDHLNSLDAGMYFMPELQAFAPESFNAVVSLDQAPLSLAETESPATRVCDSNTCIRTCDSNLPTRACDSNQTGVTSRCDNSISTESSKSFTSNKIKCNTRDVTRPSPKQETINTIHTQKKFIKTKDDPSVKCSSTVDMPLSSHKSSSLSKLGHLRSTVSSTSSSFSFAPMKHSSTSDCHTHRDMATSEASNSSISTHFNKSKVNKKNIRVRRSDSRSSSEDEER